jgi:uroporphyrin-III C-methyltransferase/precorrin-2 dehydrogenase/sirohydrochlorin ferrochelatase
MRYFPLFMDLKDRRVLVVGGGEEALRKVRLLLKTDARIEVVAPALHRELRDNPRVGWIATRFIPSQISGASLVYVADTALTAEVSAAARAQGVPVNAVDAAEHSTFITPSIVDRDPVVVAIGTEGTAPVLGQGIRTAVETLLPQKLGLLARAAEALRSRVAGQIPAGNRRRAFWQSFFFGAPRQALLANDAKGFEQAVEEVFAPAAQPARGRVALVGAGPGDAELLTLKALRKLQEADVIVYDRLVSAAVLDLARRDAVRIPVGKTPYQPSPRQPEINTILVREAQKGQLVVRLKGGDPYVFGRGAEEQAALEAEGIPVDVVPGITAALGCAAALRLPLTQRGQNRSFTLLTAASEDGVADHDWASLARPGAAFAIYMGVRAAGDVSSRLLDAGIDPGTPVTVVENGTTDAERVVTATIGSVWEAIELAGITGPALIYVGLKPASASAEVIPFPAAVASATTELRVAS